MQRRSFIANSAAIAGAGLSLGKSVAARAAGPRIVEKDRDLIIYKNPNFYCAFPSIVRRPDGEMIVAFRRAPARGVFGESGTSHTDPNSYLVLVRSNNHAVTWSEEPELIHAHAFGGSQDPCMVQLSDGTLICSSYAWARVETKAAEAMTRTSRHGNFAFLGGYLMISEDNAQTWDGPVIPPPLPGSNALSAMGRPLPSYNRGAMCEGSDGRLYWAIAGTIELGKTPTSIHLMISEDKGRTWEYSCPIAVDEKVTFNETSLIETPKGDLVAFVRTANFDDHTVIVRSRDRGKSFEPWADAGFQGHPHHAIRFGDSTLLVYGYRHQPFGIRVRLLDAECANPAEATETVIRDDGANSDLGYPWLTQLDETQALAVYYINTGDGIRHIAGTVLNISSP